MQGVARNQWYVIALSSEITSTPIARTVAGEQIVCYRVPGGRVVALRDRCPHRRYPLSLGRLNGEVLTCGYHGFCFQTDGRCIVVPGQERIPAHADVAVYELEERGLWTWVWIGDSAAGDRRPPATPWLTSPDSWSVVTGMAPIECRTSLLVDNLLDLSHETYLHGGSIGTPEVAATPTMTTIDRERNVIAVSRHMDAVECPEFYARTTGLTSPIDRWQDIEFFAPSFYLLHVRIAPAGVTPERSGEDPQAFHMKILYGLTPSTTGTTYDFWAVCRDFAIGDQEVDKFLDTMQREVVQQDVDALNIVESRIANDPDPFEVVLGIDRGALAARRMIQELAGGLADREGAFWEDPAGVR